jgi:hypothetical protein
MPHPDGAAFTSRNPGLLVERLERRWRERKRWDVKANVFVPAALITIPS